MAFALWQLILTVNGVASNHLTFTVGDNSPTISGTHFGLNPTLQISGVGVNATITSSSPTQITAYFSVADATIIGTRGVQVKSRGISGITFQTTPQTSDLSNFVGLVG